MISILYQDYVRIHNVGKSKVSKLSRFMGQYKAYKQGKLSSYYFHVCD